MALRQILLAQQIEQLEQQRTALNTEITNVSARRTAWAAREAAAEAAFGEINENTPQEERDAFDAEAAAIEAEDNEIRAEEERTSKRLGEIDAALEEKRAALEEIKNRSKPAPAQTAGAQNGGNTMENREFFGMSAERRDAFFAREDVKGWLANVRTIARTVGQTRAVTGQELLIPEVVLPLIYDSINKNSKLLKHVNVQRVGGTARQTIMGEIPEAVWTEMCKKLNELELNFSDVEVDGYMVGGYIKVCNALLEDNDVALATHIINAFGQSIGYAEDKAIVYGKGTKMPLGFVTRLAQTTKPENAPATAREWENLSATNIITIPETEDGASLFALIVRAASNAKAKNGNGKFWTMNEATYGSLMAELITFNSSGAIVSGMNMQMPVVGGQIEILDFMPDNNIGFGYGSKYLFAERAGTSIASSDHQFFVQNETVFRGIARADGVPVIAEAFVLMGIHGTAPTTSVSFAADTANQ